MDDNHNDPLADTETPFWRKPLPPIKYPAVDVDPLADGVTLSERKLDESTSSNDEVETALPPESDGAAPADAERGTVALPQARSVTPTLSVIEAQRLLAESHQRMARAADKQRTARGNVAIALAAFQKVTMQTQTQEQLIRQHIESENQLRADRAAGKIAPRGGQRRLGSAVDAYAFYTKAAGRGAGGGRAFSRKAYPASMRGRTIPK